MSQENEWIGPMLTRRTVLTQAVVGTALVTAAPYLSRAEALLATGSSSPRVRDSFDFGWKFMKGDLTGAQDRDFADASWRDIDLPHDWSVEGKFDQNEPSAVLERICRRASHGIARPFAFPRRIAVRSSLWNSMAYIRTAKYG